MNLITALVENYTFLSATVLADTRLLLAILVNLSNTSHRTFCYLKAEGNVFPRPETVIIGYTESGTPCFQLLEIARRKAIANSISSKSSGGIQQTK